MAGQDTNKLVIIKKRGENNNLFHLLQVMGAGGAGALVFLLIVLVAVTTR